MVENSKTSNNKHTGTFAVLSEVPEAVGPDAERRCRAGRVHPLRARAREEPAAAVHPPGQEPGRQGGPGGDDRGVQGARHRHGPG